MDFKDLYQKSISKPEEFWREISNDIFWFKKPTKILNNTKMPFTMSAMAVSKQFNKLCK